MWSRRTVISPTSRKREIACCECCGELLLCCSPTRASAQVRFHCLSSTKSQTDFVLCLTMSSLHSCHWDWCRFTTVLHDDFVQHVVSTHIDKAEPINRADISLIRKVQQGAPSGHSGEPAYQFSCGMCFIVVDSIIGGISDVTVEATGTSVRSEAPQPSVASVSTFVLPHSQQMQHTTTSSDGSLAGVGHHSRFIHLLHSNMALSGPESGYITAQPTNTGII
jgi:hypothetical protein